MKKLLFPVLFLSFFLFAGSAAATTYYIDYSSGSDSNSGTTTSAPWMHLPGMQGCSSTCASTSPNPGDSFILKGGVTWPNAAFPITWSWSGASGNYIYVGVDNTWYTGSSWTRPIWNAGSTGMGSTNNYVRNINGGSYTTWDNIEMLNFVQQGDSYGNDTFMNLGAAAGGITNVTVTNCYFHHWSHGSQTADAITIILGSTNSPYLSGSVIESNIADNTDGDKVSGEFLYAIEGTIAQNVVKNVANGILPIGPGGIVAANNIGPVNTSFDPSTHENGIELVAAGSSNTGTWYIHDNVIHDGVGESSMIGNNGETDYVWNNIIYNWSGNAYHFAQDNGQSITALTFWNNTIVPSAGGDCFIEVFSPSIGSLTIQNNHCITTGALTSSLSGVGSQTVNSNILQTPTTASGLGFASTETYAYAPTGTNISNLAAGVNLSANCSGNLAGLCSDTSYACTVNAATQVVCPGRVAYTRPSGSVAWDESAYSAVSSASQPAPPTNVAAVAK